jgi:hypothetical protein
MTAYQSGGTNDADPRPADTQMTDTLNQLESLARKATPGPWMAELSMVRPVHGDGPDIAECAEAELAACRQRVAELEQERDKLQTDKEFEASHPQGLFSLLNRAYEQRDAALERERERDAWIVKHDESGQLLATTVAERDALRTDAERLNKLESFGDRDVTILAPGQHGGKLENWLLAAEHPGYGDGLEWEGATLRDAIDAAMKEAK